MSIKFSKSYYLVFALLALISAAVIYWGTKEIINKEEMARALRLERANKTAALEFKEAISSYATLLTGIKGYIEMSPEVPSKEDIEAFLNNQLDDLKLSPPFSVSYIDTSHVFKFDFTREGIPNIHLEGTSIKNIIGESGIKRMDTLMLSNGFYASNPTNLLEGKAGLPLGFGVLDSTGTSLGYITSVAELIPIMERVYSHFNPEEFVCKFYTEEGVYFDKTRAYNSQKIYATSKDSEYYGNFNVSDDAFVSTTIPFYNKKFTVSTAYKNKYAGGSGLYITSFSWYLLVLGFMLFITSQLYVYKRKNKIINAQKQQLTELVATKNKFFSIIAHDLRSPLSSVINFLDVLKEEEFKSAQTSQIVGALGDSSRNSLTLLDNLLKWSKVQTGNISYKPQKIDMLSIVKDQVRIQEQPAANKNIKIVVEATANCSLEADKNMIATVIRNLLSNAVKFSNLNSIIVIEVARLNKTVSVSVEDSGIGMPKEYLDRIFDVTMVTTQEGTQKEKGSGLGLILCKQFIEMHEGTLIIESTKDKGTIASFSLPV